MQRSVERAILLTVVAFMAFYSTQAQTKTDQSTAKTGTLSICKEIDDNWKCVGEAPEWKANERFNVLFINPDPVKVDFVGIMFYKQLADGKDGDFLYEFQQNVGAENRKYATTEAPFFLPAGTYTVYVISWGKRESLYKKGNYADYFAKATLKVK